MQALILAAGEGTRFSPLTTPKPLLTFTGTTLLERLISQLKSSGVREITVVANEKEKSMFDGINGAKVIYQKSNLKGMSGAVLSAKDALEDGPVLILDGAKVINSRALKSVLSLAKDKSDVVLSARKVKNPRPGGYFKIKGKKVTGLVEKPKVPPSDMYRIVIDLFKDKQEFLSLLSSTKSEKDDIYEKSLNKLIKGNGVKLNRYEGPYASLKRPHDVLEVTELLLDELKRKVSPDAKVHKSAVLEGEVVVEEGAVILPHATIVGPAYIGKNVVIGNGSLIRSSLIEEGSKIGFGTEVARSYIGKNTRAHHTFIGDSVIEGESNIAAGTMIANVLFNRGEVSYQTEKEEVKSGRDKFGVVMGLGVKTGINSSIMPGTTIGENVIVGSGATVTGHIKEGQTIKVKFSK